MKENFFTRIFGRDYNEALPESSSAIYTAEDVHRDLTAFILLFLSDIREEIERKEVPMEVSKTSSLLEQLGLTNTTNAKILGAIKSEIEANNAEYDRKKTQLAFMSKVWEKFGKDAMVVRYDHFFNILEKYDMVCGSFDRYTGTIPQSALETLSRLHELKEESDIDKFFAINTAYFDTVTTVDAETLINIARMPFIPMEWSTHKEISNIRGYGASASGYEIVGQTTSRPHKYFIAAPAADMKPLKISVKFDPMLTQTAAKAALSKAERWNPDLARFQYLHGEERARIRNKAIRKEEARLQSIIEKSGIGRYCDIDFIKTKPIPERKLYDPFICSLTTCGVLIHAKWGPEAEDATIKRYEELRDTVIGK